MDEHSEHVSAYHAPIFGDQSPSFSEEVFRAIDGEIVENNLLILDRLELLPDIRGRGIGLKIIRHMINRFGAGAGLVGIKPFPLQLEGQLTPEKNISVWRKQLNLDKYPQNESEATKKLRNYYSKVGFKDLPGTPYMVFSTAYRIPNIDT